MNRMNPNISASNIGVEFPIFNASHRSLRNKVLNYATGGRISTDSNDHLTVRALHEVSFEFQKGDRVGLIGHNGSGKSTLLRVLAGVYTPTTGSINVNGSISSLLDISLGMDGESTGYENIMLRGILMGLSPSFIDSKVDEIAEFSELGAFLNIPIRTYSSGMMVRLAFAVSTCITSDILLMDEWLSVGDSSFNQKASERLHNMVEESSILVIASHSPDLVKRICNKVIHLEHGKMISYETISDSTNV